MTITTRGTGDEQIDVGRLSIRAAVSIAITVAVVAWVLSAAAAFFGVQLALSQIRSDQERDRDKAVMTRDAVEKLDKAVKLIDLNDRAQDNRLTMLEAGEKARAINAAASGRR